MKLTLSTLCALVVSATAKKIGYQWVVNFAATFKRLVEGDLETLHDSFASGGRICFNKQCGGTCRDTGNAP
jgi:hypothetical protein